MTQVITEQGDLGLGVYDCPDVLGESNDEEPEDEDKK